MMRHVCLLLSLIGMPVAVLAVEVKDVPIVVNCRIPPCPKAATMAVTDGAGVAQLDVKAGGEYVIAAANVFCPKPCPEGPKRPRPVLRFYEVQIREEEGGVRTVRWQGIGGTAGVDKIPVNLGGAARMTVRVKEAPPAVSHAEVTLLARRA